MKAKIEFYVLGGKKNLRLSEELKELKAHPDKSFLESRYFLSSHHELIYSFSGAETGYGYIAFVSTHSEHSPKSA